MEVRLPQVCGSQTSTDTGKRIKKVLVFGTFDGLHPGHLNFLEQAKQIGDHLVAVVARDETVRILKGHLPKLNENQRLAQVKASKLVDEAYLGGLGDHYEVVRTVKPDIIALGYDQTSFTDDLANELKKAAIPAQIVRLQSFEPDKYHTSIIDSKKK
ncbi:MAG: FAD synthase [Candidatus Pacebacteria bacterium]|nr:FAD synthase [Candidatus Paceibacterota bacterium]